MSTSETTATAVGLPPAPWPRKVVSPPNLPVHTTTFCGPLVKARVDERWTRAGPTAANKPFPINSALDTWRIVQPSCLAYSKSSDSTCEIDWQVMLLGFKF